MPETSRFLTESVIDHLRLEIEEAEGTEIFAVLTKGEGQTLYNQVAVICRGTTTEVPALISRCHPGDMTLHNHPSGALHPSDQDMRMATLFGEEGVGMMIVDNPVANCRVVVEPSAATQAVDVDEDEITSQFSNDGLLAQKLDQFEMRPGQVEMAIEVTRAFNHSQVLGVEAGTGTGKSLAYLIPAMIWARDNKRRVVIATKTIALQEQLVFKDIPLAQKVVNQAPRASLVKGRGNYVCLRKMNDLKAHQLHLFDEDESALREEIEALTDWVAEGGSGDRADLPFMPSREAWEAIRSDADMCLGSKCPFFQSAPFYESRREAVQSRILVVNQALLFSDLAVRKASENYKASAVIPAYDHVIVDEAHNIEDIATDHFGMKATSFGLRANLNKLLAPGKANKGLLYRLYKAAVDHAPDWVRVFDEDLLMPFRVLQDQALQQLAALTQCLHTTFNPNMANQVVIWLKANLIESGRLAEAQAQTKFLLEQLFQITVILRRMIGMAGDQNDAFLERIEGLLIEIQARLGRLDEAIAPLKNFAIRPGENQIPWLELRRGRNFSDFQFCISPLDVSPTLKSALFEPFKSIVMTSATLDLRDQFQFFAQRNGLEKLDDRTCRFVTFPSPFDYQSQARLFITRMNSMPDQPAFADELANLIIDTALCDYPGGTLVLFTSYKLLNAVAGRLENPLAQHGVELLVQGRAQRSYLAERLKSTRGVLLGTDSFWEGVDLAGDALTKLIITKLPFRQMGEPIFEARCAALEAEGHSSFSEYSLPLALLKFKQGAGRLIRGKEDRGILIVADNRIRQKGYGRRFLAQIDHFPVWESSHDTLIGQLNDLVRA